MIIETIKAMKVENVVVIDSDYLDLQLEKNYLFGFGRKFNIENFSVA